MPTDWVGQHGREIAAGAIVALSALLGLLARRSLLERLSRLAERTDWRADDALVASLRRPLPLWFTLAGLALAARVAQLTPQLTALVGRLLVSLLIVSITLWAADLGGRLLQTGIKGAGVAATPVAGVVRRSVQATVLGIGALALLGNLGISIAPVLTTLGIGGLAVALGLQDTLANLFAGIHLTLAGNIRVGDFVRLESGEEGHVEDISWRATRLRTLPNNLVLIPNSRLAQNVVTNYHLPSRELAVLVDVGVHYDSDLERVERVACAVGRTIMRTVPGGVRDFEPFIRYRAFGESSIDFTVILRAREFTDNFLVKHEFVKALTRAFAAEGIVIPYPIRALNMDQERVRQGQAGGG